MTRDEFLERINAATASARQAQTHVCAARDALRALGAHSAAELLEEAQLSIARALYRAGHETMGHVRKATKP